MDHACKHCESGKRVKNGYVRGKQRRNSRDCGKTDQEGDLREKYTNKKRIRIVKWYLEGAGIMSIERIEGGFITH